MLTHISPMSTASHERLGKFEVPKLTFLSCYNHSLYLHFVFFTPSNFVFPALLFL